MKRLVFALVLIFSAARVSAGVSSSVTPTYKGTFVGSYYGDATGLSNTVTRVTRITLEGQSNCLGVGSTNGLPWVSGATGVQVPFERVWIWNPLTTNYEKLAWTNNMACWDSHYALAPLTNQTFGPEYGIAVRWTKHNATGNLYIDKNPLDGGLISQFLSTGDCGANTYFGCWTNNLARRSAANAWLAARGLVADDFAWVWIQGESDAGATQGDYEASLYQLYSEKLAAGLIKTNTRVVLTKTAVPDGSNPGVGAAKVHFASTNGNAVVVSHPPFLYHDQVHLNTFGACQLGFDIYSAVFGSPIEQAASDQQALFVSTYSGSYQSDGNDNWLGFGFVPTADLIVTAVGRDIHKDDNDPHMIGLWTTNGVALWTNVLNAAQYPSNTVAYYPLTVPFLCRAGSNYFIGSKEPTSDRYETSSDVLYTNAFRTVIGAMYTEGKTTNTFFVTNKVLGVVNFRWKYAPYTP